MSKAFAGLAFAVGVSLAASTAASAQTVEWVAGQLGGGWYVMSTGMAHGAGISYDRLEDLLATLQRR